jgi:hypothetical protein
MPMIGGEMAAEAAPASRRVTAQSMDGAKDAYDLGWVADWLYGDAALPPTPLPPREPAPAFPRRAPVHAEAAVDADVPVRPRSTPARRRARTRQLVLL